MNSLPIPNISDNLVIFYVDNDIRDLRLMASCLRGGGFKVICESSPSAALSYIQDLQNRLDLLIADLRMPEIGGIQLVTQAKMHRPNLPTIGLTHYPDSTDVSEFKDITDHFFEKTSDFYRTAGTMVHNILDTIESLPREALVRRAIHTAIQRWHSLEPNSVHVSPELMDDPNFQEFMLKMEELESSYPGEYVAFVDGKFIDHDADQDTLLDRVYEDNEEPVDVFIQKLAKPRMVHLRSPKKVSA